MVFNNNLLLGVAGQADAGFDSTLIGNSVWLDGSDDDFDRSTTSHSSTEVVMACWFQLNKFSGNVGLMGLGTGTSGSTNSGLWLSDGTVYFYNNGYGVTTNQLLRDTGWYHILGSWKLDESTASNKGKLFINGSEVTSFAADPRSSWGTSFGSTATQSVGSISTNTFLTGYIAQPIMLDGQSVQGGDVAITDFVDTFTFGTNGSQVIPKKNSEVAALASSAGGNSFCLDFADSTGTNAANLGNDISSNNKDLTVNGTMSSANQTIHTPSNVYPKISILGKPSGSTAANYSMSRGSNRMTYSGAAQAAFGLVSDKVIQADDPKIYWEFYVEAGSVGGSGGGRLGNGIVIPQFNMKASVNANGFYGSGGESAYFQRDSMYDNGSASVSGMTAVAVGGIQQMAFEPSTGKVWIGQDGTWRNGSATASTTLNINNHDDQLTVQDYIFVIGLQRSGDIGVINFGDNPTFSGNETAGTNADENGHGLFKYAVPSTFLAPCSANLTGPENQGVDYFNAVKYTGNGTAIGSGGNAVTGAGFKPDWVWLKNRSAGDNHALYDIVRGVTKQLESNTGAVESTQTEGLTTFGSDGFTVGSLDQVNTNTENFISWNWLASNSTSTTSPAGTIPSTSSVASAGHFSVGTYTGQTDAGTVGHGLGGVAEMVIVWDKAFANSIAVYHVGVASDAATDYLLLSQADGATDNATFWNDTAPNSEVFSVGTGNNTNGDGRAKSFQAFRSVPGVCKVGSYIGNGDSTVPPYVHLGFRPRFVMVKNATVARDWVITDTARSPINPAELFLFPNEEEAEAARGPASGSDYDIDLLAEGFRPLTGDSAPNGDGNTIVYMAMADIGGNGILPPIYGR